MVIAGGRLIIQPGETLRGAVVCPQAADMEEDHTCPLGRRGAKWPEGEWKCILDPSGDFVDGRFTIYDLRFTSAKRNWAEGTRFENLRNGNMLVIRKGILRQMT